jgi:ribosomal protein L37AE/L43A
MTSTQPPETLAYNRSAEKRNTTEHPDLGPVPSEFRSIERNGGRRHGTATWLEDKKEASRRAAKITNCRKCGQQVITGASHDHCSITVTVDPEPVSYLAEVAAYLTGHRAADYDGTDLNLREWITSPAKWPVHLIHQCGPRKEKEVVL